MRTVVVIPAYNEERTVGEVVRNVRAHVPDVIVVDDGSDDATGDRARHAGATVITHCVNRGLGAALGTGLAAALGHRVLTQAGKHRVLTEKHPMLRSLRPVSSAVHEEPYSDVELAPTGASGERADTIITLDADGQHDPQDIAAVIAPIQAGFADLVIGTRFARGRTSAGGKTSGVDGKTPDVEEPATAPWHRCIANTTANLLTRFLFGVQCSDTQSGFRAFNRRAAQQIDIRTNRMEVSSEILAEAARLGLRIAEVPIRTIYTEYSLSKGQGVVTGARTAWSLILRRFF